MVLIFPWKYSDIWSIFLLSREMAGEEVEVLTAAMLAAVCRRDPDMPATSLRSLVCTARSVFTPSSTSKHFSAKVATVHPPFLLDGLGGAVVAMVTEGVLDGVVVDADSLCLPFFLVTGPRLGGEGREPAGKGGVPAGARLTDDEASGVVSTRGGDGPCGESGLPASEASGAGAFISTTVTGNTEAGNN
jgi:hypothetical protein